MPAHEATGSGQHVGVLEQIAKVEESAEADVFMDAELEFGLEGEKETISANVNILPLIGDDNKKLGSMIMIEDSSSEKRMKSTMSRYMDPGVADRMIEKKPLCSFDG